MKRFLGGVRDWLLTVFQSRINSVEKNLGLDVASYFVYSKWLFYHNLVSIIVILLPFMFIPHLKTVRDELGKPRGARINESCFNDEGIQAFYASDLFLANVS